MLKTLSKICLLYFLFIMLAAFYIGISSSPHEGDSLNYHIPIAKSYLDGNIFFPQKINGAKFLKFFPGASEGILALFYLAHIPPNLFNVLGVIFLFVSLYFLGKNANLGRALSLIFASSFATLNGITRWMDTQVIDIYLAAYFVLCLALLLKPEKKISFFLKLGIVFGLLIGTKYTGILFAAVLIIIYIKKLLKYLSVKNILAFLIPFSILGLSWYLRNFINVGNPFYPQGFLFFKDTGFRILQINVLKVAFGSSYGFWGTINAFVSEYMVWCLSIPIALYFVLTKVFSKSKNFNKDLIGLLLIGIFNFISYLFLTSDNKDYIMVSVIRYSYPALIPFVLLIFKMAKEYKKEVMTGVVALGNMFWIAFPIVYNPKLIFIYLPIAIYVFYKKF